MLEIRTKTGGGFVDKRPKAAFYPQPHRLSNSNNTPNAVAGLGVFIIQTITLAVA